MRLPGQSNKQVIPGLSNITLFFLLCKFFLLVYLTFVMMMHSVAVRAQNHTLLNFRQYTLFGVPVTD